MRRTLIQTINRQRVGVEQQLASKAYSFVDYSNLYKYIFNTHLYLHTLINDPTLPQNHFKIDSYEYELTENTQAKALHAMKCFENEEGVAGGFHDLQERAIRGELVEIRSFLVICFLFFQIIIIIIIFF